MFFTNSTIINFLSKKKIRNHKVNNFLISLIQTTEELQKIYSHFGNDIFNHNNILSIQKQEILELFIELDKTNLSFNNLSFENKKLLNNHLVLKAFLTFKKITLNDLPNDIIYKIKNPQSIEILYDYIGNENFENLIQAFYFPLYKIEIQDFILKKYKNNLNLLNKVLSENVRNVSFFKNTIKKLDNITDFFNQNNHSLSFLQELVNNKELFFELYEKYKFKLDQVDSLNRNFFHYCKTKQSLEVANFLYENNVPIIYDYNGMTPIFYIQDKETLEWYIDKNLEFDAISDLQINPFFYIIDNKTPENIVSHFISLYQNKYKENWKNEIIKGFPVYGFSNNQLNKYIETFNLTEAIYANTKKIKDFLNYCNESDFLNLQPIIINYIKEELCNDWSLLFYTKTYECSNKLLQILDIIPKEKIHQLDRHGFSILHYLVNAYDSKLITEEIIKKYNLDFNILNPTGKNLLFFASDIETAKLILQMNSFNIPKDIFKETPLYYLENISFASNNIMEESLINSFNKSKYRLELIELYKKIEIKEKFEKENFFLPSSNKTQNKKIKI